MSERVLIDESDIARNAKTGRLTRIRGFFDLPVSDEAGDSVKAFLFANSDELELGILPDDLQKVQDIETPTGRIVRFEQMVGGIPILGTEIQVDLDQASRVRQVDLTLEPKEKIIAPAGDEKMLTPAKAVKAASDSLGAYSERQKVETPGLVYFKAPDGLRLAYNVQILTTAPAHDWQMIVDAYSGSVLSKQDLIWKIDGSGKVFDPNPVVTASNNGFRDPSATVASCGFAGTAQATIDAQQVTRTLREITKAGTKYKLEGPHVIAWNFNPPNLSPPEETNPGDFNYPSDNDKFEWVMVYYHIDTFQRFIQSVLGIPNAHNTAIKADAHDNGNGGGAFYSPGDKGVHYGDSGACKPDRAEDADCILHEYNHAIMDFIKPGYGPWGAANAVTGRRESRALGEGFGDVVPCIYFGPDHAYQQEVFEDWVFAPEGLRRVDGTKMYPWNVPFGTGGDWVDEEHDDGEIWSAALWQMYGAIGGIATSFSDKRKEMLKTILSTYFKLPANPNMMEAAELFMLENTRLSEYRLAHGIEMLDAFHDRGILHCSAGSDLRIEELWSQQTEVPEVGFQKVEYGQDNWFYARVKNYGTTTARAAVVTFSFQSPYSTPVYPADMRNRIKSGAVIFNLAPGATTTVHALFPKGEIPEISEGETSLHGCILAEVYNPVDHVPPGVTSVEWMKLRQRNTDVVDVEPNDTLDYHLSIGNFNIRTAQKVMVNVIRPERWPNAEVLISHTNPRVINTLWENAAVLERSRAEETISRAVPSRMIHFVEPGQIMIDAMGDEPGIMINMARGSSIAVQPAIATGLIQRATIGTTIFNRQAELVRLSGKDVIRMNPGRMAGFPYTMRPRQKQTIGIQFKIPADARPGDRITFKVEQVNEKNEVIGGFDVLANVVARR